MPVRTTQFATGPMMRVFRKVEEILRADPVLAGNVRTWSTWDGTRDDSVPLTRAMCPYLQLSPVALPSEQQSVSHVTAFLGVRITVAVDGLIAEDVVNFWDAVQDAVAIDRPFREGTVYCTLQGVKAFSHRFVTPGFDAWRSVDNPPETFLKGSGLLVLRVTRTA